MNGIAYLSNNKDIISFTYGDKVIRFRGPYSLDSFLSTIKKVEVQYANK